MTKTLLAATVLAAVTLVACGDDNANPGHAAAVDKASVQQEPRDKQLAEVYNRSCRSCHTVAASGAPLTGDRMAWGPRLGKGMDTLVDNVVNGFGGMPPFGLCMDCDVEQFEALIRFMAQGD